MKKMDELSNPFIQSFEFFFVYFDTNQETAKSAVLKGFFSLHGIDKIKF